MIAKPCSSSSCSWVTKPYKAPRPCVILRGTPRLAIVFGEDSAGCPIVCDRGDHPLLYSHEWHYPSTEQELS